MNAKKLAAAAALGLAVAALGTAPADAGATGIYKNCTKLNHKYPHGVGRAHAHDHTSGTPVRNFKHSTKIYKVAMRHNKGLDRDKDGIACEKA
ncbi:excalibur calcium-binding domain-containing protein [Nocardioides terrisoli]|uniref:excalibur calcium-binding domain-containing protein n=1 Tax=Nocardioides terrisoli TaxID=3388267 RepID=UPI00287B7902|nr:excalibur calcium-binding domain-containing protein [Nocardioides marmorisolisilvae]